MNPPALLRQHPRASFATAALLVLREMAAVAARRRLATLTGEREVHELFLGVDEPERLLRALNEPGTHPA
jgi:hypothetical protein